MHLEEWRAYPTPAQAPATAAARQVARMRLGTKRPRAPQVSTASENKFQPTMNSKWSTSHV
eukprot:15431970-Alexandrium_andersonii.AAC.1